MLQVRKSEIDALFALWTAAVSFAVGVCYLIAFLDPERNRMTKWINRYLQHKWLLVRGRSAALIISIGGFLIAAMCVGAFFFASP